MINIKNSCNLPEGKRRLYEQAAKGFQIFIDSKDIEFDASKEMLDTTYYVLLYYVDKLYPGIEVELDSDNKGLIINENQGPSDRSPRLLEYLIKTWINHSNLEAMTIFDIMMVVFLDL